MEDKGMRYIDIVDGDQSTLVANISWLWAKHKSWIQSLMDWRKKMEEELDAMQLCNIFPLQMLLMRLMLL